eukprot:1236318-Rhodomonas_salina.1
MGGFRRSSENRAGFRIVSEMRREPRVGQRAAPNQRERRVFWYKRVGRVRLRIVDFAQMFGRGEWEPGK